MKVRTVMVGLGGAFALALSAQAAMASPVSQCEGGDQATVGDNGSVSCGIQPLVVLAVNGSDEQVTVSTEIENGDELLPEGTIIEVEIDFDEVVASLDPSDARKLYLAAVDVADLSPSPERVAKGREGNAALSPAERKVAVSYLAKMVQSRGTGRSDPAGSNTTRRESTSQAITRAVVDWIRNPSIPGFRFTQTGRVREYYPNGQLKREERPTYQMEVGS